MIWRWLLLLLMLCATPVRADELRPGYLEFTQKTQTMWKLVWKAPFKTGITAATQPVLPQGCLVQGTPARERLGNALLTTATVNCARSVSDQYIGLADLGNSQTDILVRVAPLGRRVQAMRLTAAQPLAQIKAKPARWQVARTYFTTGVGHILFGYDHLLFVVSLVLLLSSIWTIAKAVTAFTLAHSITLIGTTLGLIGLPQAPVESVIALSIMFLAVEIVKKEPDKPRLSERVPWVVAFLFGLLHGFGFAGALKEIGLPESDIATALLTFNLGVEAGQLLIVAATLTTLRIMRFLPKSLYMKALRTVSYAIGTIASFWFLERTLS